VCEQRAQCCYVKAERLRVEPATWSEVQRPNHYIVTPHAMSVIGKIKQTTAHSLIRS